METKLRGRAILIAIVVVICLLGIIGFPRNLLQLKDNLKNHIRLGLDLKGGTHLVLQVQVEDAVNITADQVRERLQDELRTRNIPFADVQKADDTQSQPPKHRILFKGIPQEKSSDLQALATEQFSDWESPVFRESRRPGCYR